MEAITVGSSFRLILRGCAIFMALAAVLIVAVYGITLWSVLAAAALLACPAYVLLSTATLDAGLPRDPGQPSRKRPS